MVRASPPSLLPSGQFLGDEVRAEADAKGAAKEVVVPFSKAARVEVAL